MHITHFYLNGVGPLTQSHLDLQDDWRGGAHSQVLFTCPARMAAGSLQCCGR